jgi:hypothetical protein
VPQAEHELQLEVWKELAVSKQILVRTTASALNLDPECSEEELRQAVERLVRKAADAEAAATAAREQARTAVATIEHKMAASQQAQTAAESALAQMRAAKEKEIPALAAERAAAAKELSKVKEQLAEKNRELKAITAALADSPENVLKKMKELRKQKQEEAEGRKLLETSLNAVRHAKREGEQKTKTALANATKLSTLYRDLHATATSLHEKLKAASGDEKPPKLPELEEKLLEEIDAANKARDDS